MHENFMDHMMEGAKFFARLQELKSQKVSTLEEQMEVMRKYQQLNRDMSKYLFDGRSSSENDKLENIASRTLDLTEENIEINNRLKEILEKKDEINDEEGNEIKQLLIRKAEMVVELRVLKDRAREIEKSAKARHKESLRKKEDNKDDNLFINP